MAVQIRDAWAAYSNEWSNLRDIYLEIEVHPADFIVAWFRGDNSSSWTVMEYDSQAMTSHGEQNGAADTAMASIDPGSNVGAKTIHGYYGNGTKISAYAVALSGVKKSDPIAKTGSGVHHYSGAASAWSSSFVSDPAKGLEVVVGHCAIRPGTWTDYSVAPWGGGETWLAGKSGGTEVYTGIQYNRVAAPGVTSNPFALGHSSGNNDYTMFGISLNGAVAGNQMILMMARRIERFYEDLRLGLIPGYDLRRRYREAMAI